MSCWLRSYLSTLAAIPELQPSCGTGPEPSKHYVALQSHLNGRYACNSIYGMLVQILRKCADFCHASSQIYAICVPIHQNTACNNRKVQAVNCVRSTYAILTKVKRCCNLPSCFRTRKHPREGRATALDGNKRAVTSGLSFACGLCVVCKEPSSRLFQRELASMLASPQGLENVARAFADKIQELQDLTLLRVDSRFLRRPLQMSNTVITH